MSALIARLRDGLAIRAAGWIINHVATMPTRQRLVSALSTGDPEAHERVDIFADRSPVFAVGERPGGSEVLHCHECGTDQRLGVRRG